MNPWNKFLSSYFGFNKQQRNGLLVLVILVMVLFAVRLSINYFIKPAPLLVADFSHINFQEENLVTSVDTNSSKNEINTETLFAFNPNTASKEQFLKLGFKEKLASTLINYRNKGGHFYKNEDLKKVYGMREEFYNTLEPYILLEKIKGTEETKGIEGTKKAEEIKVAEPNKKPETRNKKQAIELNSVDSLTLLSIKGIGPAYTKRILKYRNLLGGFYSVNQLTEVYGIKDSLFQIIKNDVRVDATLIKKVNVNSENFKEVNKHPYLAYEKVRAIFYWRKKNGPIQTTEQLKTIMADNAMFEKLKPYVVFE